MRPAMKPYVQKGMHAEFCAASVTLEKARETTN